MRLAALAILMPLAACTGDPFMPTAYEMEQDRAYCLSLGFTAENISHCILAVQQNRTEARRRGAMMLSQQLMAPTPAPPMRTTLNCTSRRQGVFVNTTCF